MLGNAEACNKIFQAIFILFLWKISTKFNYQIRSLFFLFILACCSTDERFWECTKLWTERGGGRVAKNTTGPKRILFIKRLSQFTKCRNLWVGPALFYYSRSDFFETMSLTAQEWLHNLVSSTKLLRPKANWLSRAGQTHTVICIAVFHNFKPNESRPFPTSFREITVILTVGNHSRYLSYVELKCRSNPVQFMDIEISFLKWN